MWGRCLFSNVKVRSAPKHPYPIATMVTCSDVDPDGLYADPDTKCGSSPGQSQYNQQIDFKTSLKK